jgi:hypothetical protein
MLRAGTYFITIIMYPFLIPFLILIIISVALSSILVEGFAESMIPFNSPFDPDFFHYEKHDYWLDIDNTVHEPQLYKAILGQGHVLERDVSVVSDTDFLVALNSGQVGKDGYRRHLGVINVDMLYDAINGINLFRPTGKLLNLRLVAGLYAANVILIGSTDLNIRDIKDIGSYAIQHQRKVRINVDGRHSSHEVSCREILEYYGLTDYVTLSFYSINRGEAEAYYGKKFDIMYHLDFHPSIMVRILSQKQPSLLIGLKKLREDRKFYKEYPTYLPGKHDLRAIIPQLYPYLNIADDLELFTDIIKTKYALVAHKSVGSVKVECMLNRIEQMLKDKSIPSFNRSRVLQGVADLSHIDADIEFHRGARNFFRKHHLHSGKKTSHCIYYHDAEHCPQVKPDIFKLIERT